MEVDETYQKMLEKLREHCEREKMSIYALAKNTNLSTSSLSNLLNGKTKPYVYTVTPTRLQLRVMLVHGMRLMKRRSAARSSSCWSMRNTGMKLPALRSMSRENWWQKICGTALMRTFRMP